MMSRSLLWRLMGRRLRSLLVLVLLSL